jgi:hypothetical protein
VQKIDAVADEVYRWRNEMHHSTFGKTAAAKEAVKVCGGSRTIVCYCGLNCDQQGFAKARGPWVGIEKEVAKTKTEFHGAFSFL